MRYLIDPPEKLKFFVAVLFLQCCINVGFSQASLMPRDADNYQRFLQARQFFDDQNYATAYPIFMELQRNVEEETERNKQFEQEAIAFYTIACQLMQNSQTAYQEAQAYMASNANETYKRKMGFFLGRSHFQNEKFAEAIQVLEQVDRTALAPELVDAYEFMLGYSYFTQSRYNEAEPLLASVKDRPGSPYYTDANYYYGVIAFGKKRYRPAQQAFDIAKQNKSYSLMIPYYEASLAYALGQKERALELAEQAYRNGSSYYRVPLMQLLAHGYFEKGDYAKAKPYLENFVASSPQVSREDLYELAYIYYTEKQYPQAIEQFKPLAGGQDSLSQHAMYLLGDSYLKVGDKSNARSAFLFGSQNGTVPAFKEQSLFHYGKLSYELGFDAEALQAMRSYRTEYPQGIHSVEAQEIMLGALANSSNYTEALELYRAMPQKSANAQLLYPAIAFNRAQELINSGQTAAGEALLDEILRSYSTSRAAALAAFWKGELHFRRGEYGAAESQFRRYLQNPVVSDEANVPNASYNLGYTLLRLEKYAEAASTFDNLRNQPWQNPNQRNDVLLRLGDALFMQKEFNRALSYYQQVEKAGSAGADYALYQQAIIKGAQNRSSEKVAMLKTLEQRYPNSALNQRANMEMADTYLADEQYANALPFLQSIINAQGTNAMKPEALLKAGLAYINLNQPDNALNQFRRLIENYPQSQQAEEALDNVRNIYVELGRPNEYVQLLQRLGRDVDAASADSLMYASAEMQMVNGNNDRALTSLSNYLEKYPNGRYSIAANYNLARIYEENKNTAKALEHWKILADKVPNEYGSQALTRLARHYYFDEKNYATARGYYQQLLEQATQEADRLEALRGLVRSHYFLDEYEKAIPIANDLLKLSNATADDRIFANLVLGKQAMKAGNGSEAQSYFRQVAGLSKGEHGAEAAYWLAYLKLQANDLANAEADAFDVIKNYGSHELWVTKSYILLGDIFMKQKDYFNAKATYNSVAENAAIPELQKEASDKLKEAERASAAANKIAQ